MVSSVSIKYFIHYYIVSRNYSYLIIIICLHSYMVSSININNFQTDPIWPIDGTLRNTTILDQSISRSNGNKRVLHTPQHSRSVASPLDAVWYYTQDTKLLCLKVLRSVKYSFIAITPRYTLIQNGSIS